MIQPIIIEVADDNPRRHDATNQLRITIYNANAVDGVRHPLFSFLCDRRQLRDTTAVEYGENTRLQVNSIAGRMLA